MDVVFYEYLTNEFYCTLTGLKLIRTFKRWASPIANILHPFRVFKIHRLNG
jgi:hypothetical protein